MNLTLYREEFAKATLGSLFIDGHFACHTLEPQAIDWEKQKKEYGHTAIPEGTYNITFSPSAKFGKLMPYLVNVPHFSGIMIHPGNFLADTQGCILVGWRFYKMVFGVYESNKTFSALLKVLNEMRIYGPDAISLKVTSAKPPQTYDVHPKFQVMYQTFVDIRYGKKKKNPPM